MSAHFGAHGWALLSWEGPAISILSARPLWTDEHDALTVAALTDPRPGYVLSFWHEPLAVVEPEMRRASLLQGWRSYDPATLTHLLLDQVLPRVLSHGGRLVLHAGGVRLGHQAVLVLGPSGHGKSTLTAALSAVAPILSDDAIVLDATPEGAMARATYPGLRLLPDSAAALFPSRKRAPVAAYTDKRRLDMLAQELSGQVPLGLLLLLGPPGEAASIAARRLSPLDSCMALIANGFALDPTDQRRSAERMADCARIAGAVPALALAYPRDYAALPEVVAAICDLAGTNALASA